MTEARCPVEVPGATGHRTPATGLRLIGSRREDTRTLVRGVRCARKPIYRPPATGIPSDQGKQ
jgi:hypothetical protein